MIRKLALTNAKILGIQKLQNILNRIKKITRIKASTLTLITIDCII